MWYWYHRLAHEINIFWAAHSFTTRARTLTIPYRHVSTYCRLLFVTGFWAVLPSSRIPGANDHQHLIGMQALPVFIHARLIGKLSIIEYIFVTPSCITGCTMPAMNSTSTRTRDVFIIWDKLFGTFRTRRRQVEISHGLTHPTSAIASWAAFPFPGELTYAIRRTEARLNRYKLLFQQTRSDRPAVRNSTKNGSDTLKHSF